MGYATPFFHFHKVIYHPFDGRHRNVALCKLGITQAPAVIVVNTEEDYQKYILEYNMEEYYDWNMP
jgi:hypothetical protein